MKPINFHFVLAGSDAASWSPSFIRSTSRLFARHGFGFSCEILNSTSHLGANVLSDLGVTLDFVSVVTAPVRFSQKRLFEFVERVTSGGDAIAYYADSFNVNAFKKRVITRVDYSPERLRGQYYLGPVTIYKSQDYFRLFQGCSNVSSINFSWAMVLLAVEAGLQIERIAFPVYREVKKWVSTKIELDELSELISKHLDSTGGGQVREVLSNHLVASVRSVVGNPSVSIVIPSRAIYEYSSRANKSFVVEAVRSIRDNTNYTNYEVVVVADSVADHKVLDELRDILKDKLKIVMWDKPFNFSKKMNTGVANTTADFVLLLNDDVKVINSDWLQNMLALAQRPNAGMVGAMLYYEDDTIQHAGHAYYFGSPTHIGLGLPRGSDLRDGAFSVEREVSGVTAACALISRETFVEVGGFSALLPGNFNDVDLSLKVGWIGKTIYWTPFAELYHFESKTRDAHVHYYELDVIRQRWGQRLSDSRYWPGAPNR